MWWSVDHAKKAVEADKEKKYQEALDNYMMAVEYFAYHHKYEKNEGLKKTIKSKVGCRSRCCCSPCWYRCSTARSRSSTRDLFGLNDGGYDSFVCA